jgi:uncharacterized protein YndB with AHSA1/START domain
MTVTNVQKDLEALTMTVTAEFDAPVERVWRLWDDPRQLEQWWGPPTYPATVVDHDLTADGGVSYYMTGPEGDQHRGWWRVVAVDAPNSLEFEDGFADSTGTPDTSMPTTIIRVSLDARAAGGTTMVIESKYPALEAMQKMLEMGMEEGLKSAMGQMDGLLAG